MLPGDTNNPLTNNDALVPVSSSCWHYFDKRFDSNCPSGPKLKQETLTGNWTPRCTHHLSAGGQTHCCSAAPKSCAHSLALWWWSSRMGGSLMIIFVKQKHVCRILPPLLLLLLHLHFLFFFLLLFFFSTPGHQVNLILCRMQMLNRNQGRYTAWIRLFWTNTISVFSYSFIYFKSE